MKREVTHRKSNNNKTISLVRRSHGVDRQTGLRRPQRGRGSSFGDSHVHGWSGRVNVAPPLAQLLSEELRQKLLVSRLAPRQQEASSSYHRFMTGGGGRGGRGAGGRGRGVEGGGDGREEEYAVFIY